ncbi:hypothetical protein [Stutzerimonas frequens]|uniref:hypothetical protein n=1 Tax=Stutzerimonas frequens TaxID=2968969 RepID=UPI00190B05E0|nr:hypothetical protein [Stutzerimonas frequens]MBK3757053.1 hypothetical protein [Stutzerimonas frequens]MBK3871663.1 hypothetical protein [Stutzerimonas frequens]MBK3909998.1 hypothetical protein [Stutzerimonas frequens]MBK3928433.1 hypothetical protein [Stutzerimonas frequens]
MNEALKKLALVAHAALIAKTVEKAVTCDALDDVQIGQTFTFNAVNRTKTGRLMVEGIVEQFCHMDLAKLMQHGPFTVVATYKGALTDVVCQDVSGEHFMLPSGLFTLLKRFENGDLPPELPFDIDAEKLAPAA